jgi:hypothetical protein
MTVQRIEVGKSYRVSDIKLRHQFSGYHEEQRSTSWMS